MTKQTAEEMFDEIQSHLEEIEIKLQKKVEKKERSEGKKNSHLHLLLETNVLNSMKKEAEKQNISLSEWCRKKLKEDSQLDRIEKKMERIIKKNKNYDGRRKKTIY